MDADTTLRSAEIRDITVALPAREVDNDELARRFPGWDRAGFERIGGVLRRRVAASGETSLDLAERACRELVSRHPTLQAGADALIFCTYTADHILPANAPLLHGRLRLPDAGLCFDLNMACSGFLGGLAAAKGLILSGSARNVLLVAADTPSKLVHARDRAGVALFGDGAAAAWVSPAPPSRGIRGFAFASAGRAYQAAYIPAGGFRMPRSPATAAERPDRGGKPRRLEDFYMDGVAVAGTVMEAVPRQVRGLLLRYGLGVEDVDLFVLHQGSKVVLDLIEARLGIPRSRRLRNLHRLGNTTTASIPIALAEARRRGLCAPGRRIMLSAFGVGLSWASALLET